MRRLSILLPLLLSPPIAAQQPHRPAALTADDYALAESKLTATMAPLVYGGAVSPVWLPDGRFWYRTTRASGAEIVVVDPARRTKQLAFDHPRVAAALATAANRTIDPANLPLPAPDGKHGHVPGRRWPFRV